jgi:hypothetical protein
MRTLMRAALAAAFVAGGVAAMPTVSEAQCAECARASRTITKSNTKVNTVQRVNNVTRVRTVQRVNTVNRVRNVTRNNYVNVVNRTINVTRVQPVTRVTTVTRIQPVTRVNTITRVRNVTVFQNSFSTVNRTETMPGRTVNVARTETLPTRTINSNRTVTVAGGSRTINLGPGCGCR